jgi:CHAD domain-containing protein
MGMADELERVRKTLRELDKSLKSLHGDPAPNAVHKLRTASRRVEAIAAMLEPAGPKKSRRIVKSIEPVRKAAGGVRDYDVLTSNARRLKRYVDGESLTHLLAHLEHARQQNAEQLHQALRHNRKGMRQDLREYARFVSSSLEPGNSNSNGRGTNHTREEIHISATSVVRELGCWQPLGPDNLHEFRLKVKQLRYTLQLDADADPALVEALGAVQRHIGDWHDWQQLDEIAREALVLPEDQPLLERIAATARRKYQRALTAANALRGKYLNMPTVAGI